MPLLATRDNASHPTRWEAPCDTCRHLERNDAPRGWHEWPLLGGDGAGCDHPSVPVGHTGRPLVSADTMRTGAQVLRGEISRFVRTHGCVPCGPAGRLHEPLVAVQAADDTGQPIPDVGDVVADGIDGHGQDQSAQQRGVRERIARAPLHVQQVHGAIEEFLGYARAGV